MIDPHCGGPIHPVLQAFDTDVDNPPELRIRHRQNGDRPESWETVVFVNNARLPGHGMSLPAGQISPLYQREPPDVTVYCFP
jgi:hypothetical protein